MRMWWRRPNHALNEWKEAVCQPAETPEREEEQSEQPIEAATGSELTNSAELRGALGNMRMCKSG